MQACSASSCDAIEELKKDTALPLSVSRSTVAQLVLLALCGDEGKLAERIFEPPVSTRHAERVRDAVNSVQGLPQEVQVAVAAVQELSDRAAGSTLAHDRWSSVDSVLGQWATLSLTMPKSMAARAGDHAGVARLSAVFITLAGYRECFQDSFTRVSQGFWAGIHEIAEGQSPWTEDDTMALMESVL